MKKKNFTFHHQPLWKDWFVLKYPKKGSKANRSAKAFCVSQKKITRFKVFVWSSGFSEASIGKSHGRHRKSHLGRGRLLYAFLSCYTFVCVHYIIYTPILWVFPRALLYTKTFGVVINSLPCNCVLLQLVLV